MKIVPLRILMVITTLDTGGAEKHLYLLCRELKGKGHAIDLVYLKGKGSLAGDFERLGVTVYKIRFESPAHLPFAVWRLAARIRRGRYAIVHSHLLKADLVASLACCMARPGALVASKHNDERALLNPLFSRVHGLVSKRARAVIVLSDHVGRFVVRHGRVDPNKMHRIYYGLDPEPFCVTDDDPQRVRRDLDLDPEVPVMIMVARFAPQKDHASLLEAARRLKEEGLDFRLLLVGGDPFGYNKEKMEKLCTDLRLEDRVIFTGIRNDVPALLKTSRLFVMPSNWEGLGLVFLEAMAFSLPVVATEVSAIPEIVMHGETGLLVPPGQPEALKEALKALLCDDAMVARFGAAGRLRLEQCFSLGTMADDTEKVYYDTLKNRD
ncbi:MAG: glycosyltransferase [Planctomycetota bacterium]